MAGYDTPVMRQHAEAKRAHPDAIVFFRLGDFYEMFGQDAVVAARLLNVVLTSRNKGATDEIPMCGVPYHAAHSYIARLLEAGQRVAICEQLADPQKCRGIVPREVVRVITPGLVTQEEHLKSAANNWLCGTECQPSGVGLALLDLSTAELSVVELSCGAEVLSEVGRAGPRELLLGGDSAIASELVGAVRALCGTALVRLDEAGVNLAQALSGLEQEARDLTVLERGAVGRVLALARACNPTVVLPIQHIERWEIRTSLVIDEVAQVHLELVTSLSGDKQTTLLSVLDQTRTAMGQRLLRRRLLAPLRETARIRRRLDQVELFVIHSRLRGQLREALGGVGDLERLAVRASLGQATPRDLGAIRDGLAAASQAAEHLLTVVEPSDQQVLGLDQPLDLAGDLRDELERALVERPPSQAKDGAIFVSGYDEELNRQDELRRDGAESIVALESKLRAETQVTSLKLRYTRVFGWYAEVTRAHSGRVPPEWRRKQTVAGGERYTLDALDELADAISHAEERHRERELALLSALTQKVADASVRLRKLAGVLARWDVAAALAEVAHRHDYCRPDVDESDVLSIVEGRHPVVERLAAAGRFVPNDCHLSSSAERMWLITGPNMAGKAHLRQVAEIAIMAQMGSYVPAKSATIGLLDRVLSRVGASDNLARGESTFMVEMRETSHILRSATRRSLVILDEIGRGTSTFDGLAIAWAVAEHLDQVVGCRTLFATHYHELTQLAETQEHVANYSVSAREWEGDVVFLHRLAAGAASRSYGVAVARLAGLPERVLARARALLSSFESDGGGQGLRRLRSKRQMALFPGSEDKAEEKNEQLRLWLLELTALDLDRMTPLDALSLLQQWKTRL